MQQLTIGSSDASWASRTYQEIRDCGQSTGSILIVPVGSVEQHGHHLPTGTDTILAESIAHGATGQLKDVPVLITPPVWTGHSPHHLSFGGTISIPTEQLAQHLESIAESALTNEFDALVYLNGHGGNEALISSAVSTIGSAHPEARIFGLTYFKLATSFADEIRDSDVGGISHGGEFETSLMLHLQPDLVRQDKIEGTLRDEPYDQARQDLFDDGYLTIYRPFSEYTDSGAIGDPAAASEEKGAQLYERLCEKLAAMLRDIHTKTSEPSQS